MSEAKDEFTDLSIEEALKKLNVDQSKGLSNDEAQKRLEKDGPNGLEEKKRPAWLKFLSFFWGPIPWMIEIAAILSLVLMRWPDFIVISALLLINACLGFFQEHRADNAIAALKEKLALQARVLRDGNWADIAAKDLVAGDIIQVKLGDIIPADMKLIEGEYLSVDQSALTGESLPVNKKINDSAFSGTIIKLGEMTGVVTATGMRTFFGKTAKLVDEAVVKSHLQKAIVSIGNFLITTTLGIAAILLIVSLFRIESDNIYHETIGGMIIFLLVVIVAGIPVALPAVLSVTMAIGANKMAKLKAIVSKLMAIEELAGMDVLCTDKTGTLTKNEIRVEDVYCFGHNQDQDVLLTAALASNLHGDDAIDTAILDRLEDKSQLDKFKQTKFIPFDPSSKRTEVTLDDGTIVMKGAPQIICEVTHVPYDWIETQVKAYAQRGMRTLAIAKGKEVVGLLALIDPPREDTKETIAHAKKNGIHVKMVTGDHIDIAKEIAHTLEMGENIESAREVFAKDQALPIKTIENADGFAQVFPEHKFAIVKSLQKGGHIVGMTGDGVNDAPALKQADIGFAVSNATDAARAAADIVLTKPGLSVISRAIEESRRVFGRMKSYAMYRISETIRLLLFLLLSLLVFSDHPLTAIMIITIALLNDIPIMMIAYDHMPEYEEPVVWRMSEIYIVAITLAVFGVLSTFGLFWIGMRVWEMPHEVSRTLAFFALLCGGNLTIYLTRNTGGLFAKPLPNWKFFLATLFSQIAGTLLSVYGLGTPEFLGIGWKYVLYSWIYIAACFTIFVLVKVILYKWIKHEHFSSQTWKVPTQSNGRK